MREVGGYEGKGVSHAAITITNIMLRTSRLLLFLQLLGMLMLLLVLLLLLPPLQVLLLRLLLR